MQPGVSVAQLSVRGSLTLRRCARKPALSTVAAPKFNKALALALALVLGLALAQAVTTYAVEQML